MRIDAHQHFWQYNAQEHDWMSSDMTVIQRDFLPGDLAPILKQHAIDCCIAVQAAQSAAETAFLLKLAAENHFIVGVVGWVALEAADISTTLASYRSNKVMKGFRHMLEDEADVRHILRPAFLHGLKQLHANDYTFDLLIKPHQLEGVRKAVKLLPDQAFVIDHLGKPAIQSGALASWRDDMKALAASDNVMCKLSGLVTEADWHQWTYADLYPYLDTVLEAFGAHRLMFGSDWPVCLLAADYGQVLGIIAEFISKLSPAEQETIMGGNAAKFYKL